ncbi:4212_t:CDS:2 [Cetraspora pellucida]|uniref:4212_t:CDS:1 n=1 Tax=Cetraspora pellucida TaxID=1433469 RepID=A0ACA9PCE3_9GLOM|nr:4212_t:CDS:2 [Cetraspora pellucida]
MANIQSKDDLLKELNYKLVAEIDKLRKKNAEIPELKKKCVEIEAENIKLKQIIKENANTELKDRVMKLEQIQILVTINDQNTSSTKDKKSIITNSTQLQKGESKYLFESPTEPVTSIMSSQQDIVDNDLASTLEFVKMIYKENVANEIRQYNREKKLQCDSQNDAFSSTQDHDFISPEYATEILLTSGQEKSSIFQNIAYLYEKALLDKSLDEFMIRNKVSMKKAKGQDNSSDNLPKTDVGKKTLPKIEPKLQILAELAQPKAFYVSPKLFSFKKKLSKEMHNSVINKLTLYFTDLPKLDKNYSIDTEGKHQTDSYWVLSSHCPLYRENHMSLDDK